MTPLSTKEILSRTADLFMRPDSWGQIHFATDKKGRPVEIGSKLATRWCLDGALVRIATEDVMAVSDGLDADEYASLIAPRMAAVETAKGLIRSIVGENPRLWNDAFERTQEDVLSVLRMASARAGSGA